MNLKLDENIGNRIAELFRNAGHDVATVAGQGLCSATDKKLIDVCRGEHRCFVTLDMEFSNPLIFKPSDYSGIAVLRLPSKPSPDDLVEAVKTLLTGVALTDIEGKLWIVQSGKIREYQQKDEPK